MKSRRISYSMIKKAAERIGRQTHPKKIILFGSYAYGKPNQDSDVDFLVIFPGQGKVKNRYPDVSKVLEPRPFPVDLLVRSMQQIKDRLKIGDCFIEEILEKGKVLYES